MLNAILAEPRPPDAAKREWFDAPMTALVATLALFEGISRETLPWRAPSTALVMALSCTLLFRRKYPLLMLVVAFVGVHWVNLDTGAFVLVLFYTVFRWGSGKHALLGGVLVVLGFLESWREGQLKTREDAIGGVVVILLMASLALAFRFRAKAKRRELEAVKLGERAMLARELHDSVAHHVSAIVLQAQAGQAVADKNPDAAREALRVIEKEAARTLADMRLIVAALREGAAERAPIVGLVALQALEEATHGPKVSVQLSGELSTLSESTQAALFRLAQESVTNARRHAQNATHIRVEVVGERTQVRLSVADDGERASTQGKGYGLLGMAERATLLGGTFMAGPNEGRGWTVAAALPRQEP